MIYSYKNSFLMETGNSYIHILTIPTKNHIKIWKQGYSNLLKFSWTIETSLDHSMTPLKPTTTVERDREEEWLSDGI